MSRQLQTNVLWILINATQRIGNRGKMQKRPYVHCKEFEESSQDLVLLSCLSNSNETSPSNLFSQQVSNVSTRKAMQTGKELKLRLKYLSSVERQQIRPPSGEENLQPIILFMKRNSQIV